MNILFVCTGNTCRSPMAAVLMDKIAVEKNLNVRIDSAGIFAAAGQRASANAVKAVGEMGADLSEHVSKPITRELLDKSDVILAMTEEHKRLLQTEAGDKVYTLCEYAGTEGSVSDPYGGDLDVYRACARQIYGALIKICEKIYKSGN